MDFLAYQSAGEQNYRIEREKYLQIKRFELNQKERGYANSYRPGMFKASPVSSTFFDF